MKARTSRSMRFLDLDDRVAPAGLTLDSLVLIDFDNRPIDAPIVGEAVYVRANWTTDSLHSDASYGVQYSINGVPNVGTVSIVAPDRREGAGVAGFRSFGLPTGQVFGAIGYAINGPQSVSVTLDPEGKFGTPQTRTLAFTPTLPNLAQRFRTPLGGMEGKDWYTFGGVDLDVRTDGKTTGPAVDYRGGNYTYDTHTGIDFSIGSFTMMDQGVNVIAAATGVVVATKDGEFDRQFVGALDSSLSNFVIIRHDNGFSTGYYHLREGSVKVVVGETVQTGQVLGLVGSSGPSSGPHLHFEITQTRPGASGGYVVDPFLAPTSYWESPPIYTPDLPTVIESGITSIEAFTRRLERDPTVTTFAPGQDIFFWQTGTFPAGASIEYRWLRPDGTVWNNPRYILEFGRSFIQWQSILPNEAIAGEWQVVLHVNGTEMARDTYRVIANPAVPTLDVVATQPVGITPPTGEFFVTPGRTTPIQFGTISQDASPSAITLTVSNIGTGTLTLSNPTLPPAYTVNTPLPLNIAAGASQLLELRLSTNTAGIQRGTVAFRTNDPAVPEYSFAVNGQVIPAPVVPPPVSPPPVSPPPVSPPPVSPPPVSPPPVSPPPVSPPPVSPPPVNPPQSQPDAVLVGSSEYAIGSGFGTSPVVQFYNSDSTIRFEIQPFVASFTGGVRTASGDFNNDGIADVVVGSGPGASSFVRIFDGKSQTQLFSVAPFESSFVGGVYVSAGDVNGDGVADLVISPDEGGGPRVRVFSGSGFSSIIDFFGIDDTNFRGGARSNIGDLNGDGVGDLIVVAGFGGGPRTAGFDGKSLGTGSPVKIFGDFFAFEQGLRNGIFVAVGDLNGDGFADLIAGGGPGGGPRVLAFSGKSLMTNEYVPLANFFGGDTTSRGGIRVSVKNLDGDNKADLIVGSGSGAGSRVTAYLGKTIASSGTPPTAFDYDAIEGTTGGVFVG